MTENKMTKNKSKHASTYLAAEIKIKLMQYRK